jgi:small subunit ribosomal protein S6
MVKQYETVFIMTPVLSEDQIKETVGKYQSLLKDNKAEIVDENNWGMRKLAYPIQKKTSGYYYLIEFRSEGDLIAKLETAYKRDERLLRFLTVSLDKFAIAYNEKKRNGGLKSQQLAAEAKNNKENNNQNTKNE